MSSLLSSDIGNERQYELGIHSDSHKLAKHPKTIRIVSVAFFVLTVVLVYIFGSRNAEISGRYNLYVTPPGLFFAIWGAIYTAMAIANFANLYFNVWTIKIHFLLAILNILFILWVIIFDIGDNPAVFISCFILMGMAPTIFLSWIEMGKAAIYTWFIYFSRNAYAFLLGWVIAASNLSLGILLVYLIGISLKAQLVIFWIMVPSIAIGLTFYVYRTEGIRGIKCCFVLWASVIWAFVGAGIRSNSCLNESTNC